MLKLASLALATTLAATSAHAQLSPETTAKIDAAANKILAEPASRPRP